MQNKKYILLLSSLIACTGMAMDNSENSLPKWVTYYNKFNAQRRVCDQIYDAVQNLKNRGQLTPEMLLPKMQDALTSGGSEEFRRLFRALRRVELEIQPFLQMRIDDAGGRIATIEKTQEQSRLLSVWTEMPAVSIWSKISLDAYKECKSIVITGDSAWAKQETDLGSSLRNKEIECMKWNENATKLFLYIKNGYSPLTSEYSPHAFDGATLAPVDVHETERVTIDKIGEITKGSLVPTFQGYLHTYFGPSKYNVDRWITIDQRANSKAAEITIEDCPSLEHIAHHLCAEAQN